MAAGEVVRFRADENLDETIVAGLRLKSSLFDITTVSELGMKGTPDPDILTNAAREERVLLTHDMRTMPGHLADLLASGTHGPGNLVVPQGLAIGLAISDLLLVWEASAPEEWRDSWNRLPL
jgi:hypothetical protein